MPRKRKYSTEEERLLAEAARKRVSRGNISDEENSIIRANNARRGQLARQNESESTREARQLENRQRQRTVRAQQQVNSIQSISESRLLARNTANHPDEYSVGKLDVSRSHCLALHFSNEQNSRKSFSTCCNSGKIQFSLQTDYPTLLKSLFSSENNASRHFINFIRKYNSAFAFASFGYQSPNLSGNGPPVFVIHGQVHHRTASALTSATSETQASYAQLYMLDPEFALSTRRQNPFNRDLNADILKKIDDFLREHNPFAKAYKMMKDVIEVHKNNPDCYIKMWITKDRQTDLRRYNLPVANEVAAVFTSTDGEPPFNRDIAVHSSSSNTLQQVSLTSANCDPLTYPLLFPFGNPGWQVNMRSVSGSKITQQGYYGYMLHDRPGSFNPLLHAGKLTEQFIVDAFLKIEGCRLHWTRTHQKDLRVDLYLGLMDFVNTHAQHENLKAGKIYILPSSFYGGKRAMDQNYQDAMAMVARFGKPDLFITFTCNPSWTEIQESLAPAESTTDRPDVVATVFHLKLKELLDDLTKKQVLGKVTAYQYVIEFQKRGLPHCHMLLMLGDEDKPREIEDIDSIVTAEIPDSATNQSLYDIVSKSMIHGPCGLLNPTSPCMDEINGEIVCTKGFPKPFLEITQSNVDGYPKYKRRNNNKVVTVRTRKLDNRWVVPYNPYLTQKFNAHINVEICSSVKSVKYIFKYIHKGHDAAVVRVSKETGDEQLDWDEVQHYINARYLAAPEAIWRIREYKLYDRSHAIVRLPVHLPNQQRVVFETGNEQQALELAQQRGTELTAFFALNRDDPNARQFLYREIPLHYVFHSNQNPRVWLPRQRINKPILSRIYTVSPKDIERFCLKLLLDHIPGPQSFDNLKTVNGITYQTFKEAALEKNLLEDDNIWNKTLDEAVNYQMPGQLRMLFATILINCEPSDPKLLYGAYSASLREDFERIYPAEIAEHLALGEIEDHLLQFGKNTVHFGLPIPDRGIRNNVTSSSLASLTLESEQMCAMLNEDQIVAYNQILSSVFENSACKCFYLSGFAGTGKTFLYTALTKAILSKGFKVKCVAPTGLAATLLPGGKTVHSGFALPLNLTRESVSNIKHGSKEWNELKEIKLIIWDEISMCHRYMLEAVNRSMMDLLNKSELFGGITIVVGGDFRQQAPVVRKGNRVTITEASVKFSSLWPKFKTLNLTKNMRVNSEEVEFQKYLLNIGDLNAEFHYKNEYSPIPCDIITSDIVYATFGEDINNLSTDEIASRAILTPKNVDTMKLNETILNKLNGNVFTKFSIDKIECSDGDNVENYTIEFINSLTPMGMAPHQLNLKEGCVVMLLRNLNPKMGLCNGTRLIVNVVGEHTVQCKVFCGDKAGLEVMIPRIIMDQNEDSEIPFTLRRKQFPLRLAYSMTITKSQGQTFQNIGVYLPNPVFSHGQLYTAFSRVQRKSGLKVQYKPSSKQGCLNNSDEVYIFNSVYPELLN